MADALTVQVFDENLRRRGVLPVTAASAVLRHNDVSTFDITVNGDSPLAARLTRGSHVALYDGGQQVTAGQIHARTTDMASGVTDVTINGQSYDRYLSDTISMPTPSREPDKQNIDGWWKLKASSEQIICDLVRLNVGQGALASRRRPLQVAASQGRGKTRSIETRFKVILEEIQKYAKLDGLSFRTWLDTSVTPAQPRFEVHKGRDLSRAVRLSQINGALTAYTLSETAPTVTSVLIAGQGEGAERYLVVKSGNENDWGVKCLQFGDRRDTNEPDELDQAALEKLDDGQEQASISLTATDLPTKRFGTHYGLGDTITVELADGARITDVVQSADITWGESGREVKLQVGPVADEKDAPAWIKQVRALKSRITNLETR